jgi:thioredoxin 1
MPFITLNQDNSKQLVHTLDQDGWVVACLCAAWCGSCREYGIAFETLAARYPQHQFVWIDIEDQADIIGDIDVENFPTLLIQRGKIVTFFGTMIPEVRVAERLFQTQLEKTPAQLAKEATSSPERLDWQQTCNLHTLLKTLPAH